MKTIGLLGGMSWESTSVYYDILNTEARNRLGGLHSAQILMWSFDFAEIEALQAADNWPAAIDRMIDAARNLQRGGADCIVICTNTMHKMASEVEHAVDIPLIHIADTTAHAIRQSVSRQPLLLATRYTMEQDFYKGYLQQHHGITVRIPDRSSRDTVHNIIYQELCRGVILPASKQQYLEIIQASVESGADGVIFGCTEVGMLIGQSDFSVPAFDSTRIHALAALEFALAP